MLRRRQYTNLNGELAHLHCYTQRERDASQTSQDKHVSYRFAAYMNYTSNREASLPKVKFLYVEVTRGYWFLSSYKYSIKTYSHNLNGNILGVT